jgi:glyoxylase-like metal-dependent hydrolase (beta-lactamase superfamily II)
VQVADDVRLTRVEYFDIALDAAVALMTADEITALPWAVPTWANADGTVLIGQALWVIEAGQRVIVVDPCGAADAFLRTGDAGLLHQERVAEIMRDAGFPRERIDTVVLTHLDGIGMTAWLDADGNWSPMFPNARVVMTQAELDFLATQTEVQGIDAIGALMGAGVVDGVDTRFDIAPHVVLECTGGHSPGHAVVRLGTGPGSVIMLGHLAVSPVQLAADQPDQAHLDATRANAVIHELLAEARRDRVYLAGSLWPAPGIATVGGAGEIMPVALADATG